MVIDKFEGEYRFLSNFHESPVEYGGLLYRNAEGAYQAQKTLSEYERENIACMSAGAAKKAGRKVTLRNDWEDVKWDTMKAIVRAKFEQDDDLRKKLMDTGDSDLIEGNWWKDTYWGVCDRVGENNLGKILMSERARFQSIEEGE